MDGGKVREDLQRHQWDNLKRKIKNTGRGKKRFESNINIPFP